ncbi:helix-turn-helix domain-containing protein [Nocardia gamkensis]|uniref:helix-turn-helix domain-containing protein n=1 Tax=Nocardia gamkensis TaxID=352869 RepID=UPI0036DFC9F6
MLKDKGIIVVPPRSPYVVVLTAGQRSQLEAITRRSSAPMWQVLRARIVLAAAGGQPNARIARTLAITADTARKWRKRFCGNGIDGLTDLPRGGRPRTFTAEQVAEVKALACEIPARTGLPLTRWSCPELARGVTARGVTDHISASTVRRILAGDAIKPWQHRSWIFPRDQDHYNATARPFDWTFTRDDLNDLLHRLGRHDLAAPLPLAA